LKTNKQAGEPALKSPACLNHEWMLCIRCHGPETGARGQKCSRIR
jgi:hypothetical protein